MKSIICVIAVCIFFVLAIGISEAAMLCDQTFTLYGKTAGEHSVLMWDVYVGGGCGYWDIYSVFLGNGHGIPLFRKKSSVGGGKWIPKFLSNFPSDSFITLSDSNGVFYIEDSAYVKPPYKDTSFFPQFSSIVGNNSGGRAGDWRRITKSKCTDYPRFIGATAEFVFAYDEGLYKNYKFQKVYYFPKSKYIVIVTDQAMKAIGLDTLHGLLIFKLSFDAGALQE